MGVAPAAPGRRAAHQVERSSRRAGCEKELGARQTEPRQPCRELERGVRMGACGEVCILGFGLFAQTLHKVEGGKGRVNEEESGGLPLVARVFGTFALQITQK